MSAYRMFLSLLLLAMFAFSAWNNGSGRGADTFNPNKILSHNDTLELQWQGTLAVEEFEKLVLQNCRFNMVLNEVRDLRDEPSLLGQNLKKGKEADIYVKGLAQWIKNAVDGEIYGYCGRHRKKKTNILVDLDIVEFLVWEKDLYHCDSRIQVTLKTEDNQKVYTGIINTDYEIWEKSMTPHAYNKCLSNTMVQIAAKILALPLRESLVGN